MKFINLLDNKENFEKKKEIDNEKLAFHIVIHHSM